MVVVSVRVAVVRSSVLSGCCHSGILFVVVGDRCGSIIVEVMVVVMVSVVVVVVVVVVGMVIVTMVIWSWKQ